MASDCSRIRETFSAVVSGVLEILNSMVSSGLKSASSSFAKSLRQSGVGHGMERAQDLCDDSGGVPVTGIQSHGNNLIQRYHIGSNGLHDCLCR
jgi:hypothetical protein